MREKHFADHLTHLNQRLEVFVEGTQLSINKGEQSTGGMWFVRAMDPQTIVQVMEGDPIYHSGFRQIEIFSTGAVLSVK